MENAFIFVVCCFIGAVAAAGGKYVCYFLRAIKQGDGLDNTGFLVAEEQRRLQTSYELAESRRTLPPFTSRQAGMAAIAGMGVQLRESDAAIFRGLGLPVPQSAGETSDAVLSDAQAAVGSEHAARLRENEFYRRVMGERLSVEDMVYPLYEIGTGRVIREARAQLSAPLPSQARTRRIELE